jgi:glycine cleavage system H lipoate-binding protein
MRSGQKMTTQKCIWMECGYIEYKLCDRNFDCENCPFDKAIKKESRENKSRELRLVDNSMVEKFILPDHIWISIQDNLFTLGLDDFAQKLFDKNCSINFPVLGSRLFVGKTFLWMIGSFGAIGFHSPIEGKVVWINEKVKESPMVFFEDNPFNLDLIRVESENEKTELGKFYTMKNYNELIYKDNQAIRDFLFKKLSINQSSLTLPDGGDLINNYLSILTKPEYHQLLKLIFNKKLGKD